MKIVSLIPSSTEIVHALGLGDKLVGRSHECDFPHSVQSLPVCSSSKLEFDGTSYEIDQKVKALVGEALSIYRVNGEQLRILKPDVIITQTQCEVCAVSFKDVEEAVCQYLGGNAKIVSLEPNSIEDVWEDFRRVARGCGAESRGEKLVHDCQAELKKIQLQAKQLPKRPRVATIEWMDPLMAGGNWMPTLVEYAGGENLFGIAGEHSPWMKWEELKSADPDVVLLLPCGFDIERTERETTVLTSLSGWSELKAVKNKAVFILDGNQYFNRPGPRLVDSCRILYEIFSVGMSENKKSGVGWRQLGNAS